MANSADPDQTAPQEQSDLGLHCLPKKFVPIFKYINNSGSKFFFQAYSMTHLFVNYCKQVTFFGKNGSKAFYGSFISISVISSCWQGDIGEAVWNGTTMMLEKNHLQSRI